MGLGRTRRKDMGSRCKGGSICEKDNVTVIGTKGHGLGKYFILQLKYKHGYAGEDLLY
jgi:hypothetical protein